MNEVSQLLQPSYTYHDKMSESLSEISKTRLRISVHLKYFQSIMDIKFGSIE